MPINYTFREGTMIKTGRGWVPVQTIGTADTVTTFAYFGGRASAASKDDNRQVKEIDNSLITDSSDYVVVFKDNATNQQYTVTLGGSSVVYEESGSPDPVNIASVSPGMIVYIAGHKKGTIISKTSVTNTGVHRYYTFSIDDFKQVYAQNPSPALPASVTGVTYPQYVGLNVDTGMTEKQHGANPGTSTDANDNTATNEILKSLHLISQGPCVGLMDGISSVYFGTVPAVASDGTVNVKDVICDERTGTQNQTIIPGYEAVSTAVAIGTTVVQATPVVYQTVGLEVDAMEINILFPGGLFAIDPKSGEYTSATAQFTVESALPAGAYTEVLNKYVVWKKAGPYEQTYRINRPLNTTGQWKVRISRITPDDSTTQSVSAFQVNVINEIQDVQETYPNRAIVGLQIDAKGLGNRQVAVSFDYLGRIIDVPSNYDAVARTSVGLWNGLFDQSWSDNPAWVILDMIRNSRYGLFSDLNSTSASDALKSFNNSTDYWTFYEASKYCDEFVDDGFGGMEPRFTFNYPINAQTDAWSLVNTMASNMNAVISACGSLAVVVQDKPRAPTKIITNAGVKNGEFTYSSSDVFSRYTDVNVTFFDKRNNYLPKTVTVNKDNCGSALGPMLPNQAQFGLAHNPTTVAAYGCTSIGQAIRQGRWILAMNQVCTEIVTWTSGLNYQDLDVGNVVILQDEFNSQGIVIGGRIADCDYGAGTYVVTLDRPITIQSGHTYTLNIMDPTGKVLFWNVTAPLGETTVVSFTSAEFPWAPGDVVNNEFTLFDNALPGSLTYAPKQYKIVNVTEDNHEYSYMAVNYVDFYEAIETDVAAGLVNNPYIGIDYGVISNPTSLTVESDAVNAVDYIHNKIFLSWEMAAGAYPESYTLKWRKDGQPWNYVDSIKQKTYQISNAEAGEYEFYLYAWYNYNGKMTASTGAYVTYTLDITTGGTSDLSPVTNLELQNGGGTTYAESDLKFIFTNPAANQTSSTMASVGKNFRVVFIDDDTSTPLQSITLPWVEATQTQVGVFAYADQLATGGPYRNLRVSVYAVDTLNKDSTVTSVVFANPAPATVSNAAAIASFSANYIKWDVLDLIDLDGYVVWASTTNGFTPGSGNRVFKGKANYFTHANLTPGTTYYYKVAALDTFNPDATTATGLNVTSQFSAIPVTAASDNEYRLEGVTWEPNDPSTNSVSWTAGTVVKLRGPNAGNTWAISSGNAAWTSGVLYIYYSEGDSTLSATSSLPTAIGSSKIIFASYRGGTGLTVGNGNAYTDGSLIIAGTVGAAQIVTGSAVITETAQIANAIITGALIDNATITNANITNLTIDNEKFVASAVSGVFTFNTDLAGWHVTDYTQFIQVGGTVEVTVTSATTTTQKCLITVSALAERDGGDNDNVSFRIWRSDGIVIDELYDVTITSGRKMITFTFVDDDFPAASTLTYELQQRAVGSDGSPFWYGVTLAAVLFKR